MVVGGQSCRVVRAIVHPEGRATRADQPPEVDLALLELEKDVGSIEPLGLYRGREERGRKAILVGLGDFGPAGRPLVLSDHRRRAATNDVIDAGPLRLFFRFDAPPGGEAASPHSLPPSP